ncbi:MAG: DUF748 domain-containing protein [Paludibacteraceae bacterium]|nr:DUF748 domain-containing protein [Paludibacteraceae bacterium]
MKIFKKTILAIAITIVALLLLVMALSPVAKQVVNRHGQQIIGRDMQVEKVFINPFWGTVDVRDFHCKEANGETDFVTFGRLYVQINWLSLIAKDVNLRHIHLEDFSGQVLTSDEGFNFSDIIERFASDSTEEKDTTSSGWKVRLNDIRLINGNLVYRDVPRDKRWALDHLNLNIPGLYFGNKQTNAGLDFDLPSGGNVAITAGYVMARRRYAVTLRMKDVNTDVALPLVQDYLNLKGISSSVNAKIHVDGCLDNMKDLLVTGDVAMKDLSVVDERDNEVAAIGEMRVVLDRIDMMYNRYAIDTLQITGITGGFEKGEDYTTLSRLLKPAQQDTAKAAEETSAPAAKSEPMIWSVKHLLLSGQNLTYSDKSMKPHFAYGVQSFTLKGHDLSMSSADVSLTATLTHGAHLTANLKGSLDIEHGNTTCNAKLTKVQVTDFSPFTESLMAYPLEDGVLAFETHNTLRNGQLEGTNHVTIDQMKVGNKQRFSKAKYKNIPLKLGVGLLKSAQGLIVVDLPVSGDVRSPKFNYRQIIGRALAKVFFGPLMGVKDDRNRISEDEMLEMMELLGDDTLSLATDVATVAGDSIALPEVGE